MIALIMCKQNVEGQSGALSSLFVFVLKLPSTGQMNKCIEVSENLIEKTGEVICNRRDVP